MTLIGVRVVMIVVACLLVMSPFPVTALSARTAFPTTLIGALHTLLRPLLLKFPIIWSAPLSRGVAFLTVPST
jgi:hypothetical protein